MNHLKRQHSILLESSIDRVFPLFTPIGEKLWVKGWNPEFLYPTSGETGEGMVFRTGANDEETLWTCIEWNPSAYRVRYVRVTPQSRFGFVEVNCSDAPNSQTNAQVTYTFTALTDQGRSDLEALTNEVFEQMIEGWRTEINLWLHADRASATGSSLSSIQGAGQAG